MKNLSIILAASFICAISAKSQTDFITIPTGTAPNELAGSPGPYTLGQEFTVGGPGITVTSLGAYDDNSANSFAAALLPVNVGIFAVGGPNSGKLITPEVSFTSSASGVADGDVLFHSIVPVYLAPGKYVIAASGYSGLNQGYEVFGNTAHPPYSTPPWTFNSDGGLLGLNASVNVIGSGFAYPVVVIDDTGAQPQYAAGDFQFAAGMVPDGSSTLLLLLTACGACVYFGGRIGEAFPP
jgi:hypothetical protein